MSKLSHVASLDQRIDPVAAASGSITGQSSAISRAPILIVSAGQSNVGNNNSSGLSVTAPIGKVWYWHEDAGSHFTGAGSGDSDGSTGNAWVNTAVVTANGSKYCIDVGMQRKLLSRSRETATLRVWRGSTNLYSGWAAPPNSGSLDLFGVLESEGDAAIAADGFPLGSGYSVWVIWAQGEADASAPVVGDPDLYHENYQSRLQDWWDGVKTHAWVTGRTANMIVLQLNSNNARTYTSQIRAAQSAFVTANCDAFLLDASDLPLADADHDASANLDIIGQRAADVVLQNGG
jgi:hypothetical protein